MLLQERNQRHLFEVRGLEASFREPLHDLGRPEATRELNGFLNRHPRTILQRRQHEPLPFSRLFVHKALRTNTVRKSNLNGQPTRLHFTCLLSIAICPRKVQDKYATEDKQQVNPSTYQKKIKRTLISKT